MRPAVLSADDGSLASHPFAAQSAGNPKIGTGANYSLQAGLQERVGSTMRVRAAVRTLTGKTTLRPGHSLRKFLERLVTYSL